MHRKRSKRSCTLCSAVAYCCGAVAPRAIAALLGRFLPRLGPLVHSGGPFFLSLPFHVVVIQRQVHSKLFDRTVAMMMVVIPPRSGTARGRRAESMRAPPPAQ